MNPDQVPSPNNPQNIYNPLSVMQENEEIICEIKRHPIGILGVYLAAGIVIAGAVVAAVLIPSHLNNATSQDKSAVALGAVIVSVIALLYAYVAAIVYKGNRWIVTDDSLTQVTQDGLFRKHSSQLSLANLEDVTAEQNGILQSIVGYGTLKAETAGERSKFVFIFCPHPNEYARQILTAREAFIINEPAEAARANDKLNVPAYQPQSPVPTPNQQTPTDDTTGPDAQANRG